MSEIQPVTIVNPWDIPDEKSVPAAVILAILFGPLGMFYLGAKVGWMSLLVCCVAAVVTMGVSILIQLFALPVYAMSVAQKSNSRRAVMLAVAAK